MKTEAYFDDALATLTFMPKKPANNRRARRTMKHLDEQLTLALADPIGWSQAHREDIKRASRRRRVRELLREAPELAEFDDATHADGVAWLDAVEDGTVGSFVAGMSEERKAKLHKWIQRALPVLKIIATFVPPPWSFAIVALIIVLTLIDQNRLTPKELAHILKPTATGETTPTVAV